MYLKNIFKESSIKIDFSEIKLSNPFDNLYSVFVVASKKDGNKIVIDEKSFLCSDFYFKNRDGIFSQYHAEKYKLSQMLLESSGDDGFTDIVMGYVDYKKNEIINEVYIDNFINSGCYSIIDYYFTMKNQDFIIEKNLFLKEYFLTIDSIIDQKVLPFEKKKYFIFLNAIIKMVETDGVDINKDKSITNTKLSTIFGKSFGLSPNDNRFFFTLIKIMSDLGVVKFLATRDKKKYIQMSDLDDGKDYILVLVVNNRFIKTFSNQNK